MATTTRQPDDHLVTFKLKGWPRPNMPYNEFKVNPVGDKCHMMLVNRAGNQNSLGLNQAWLQQPPKGATRDKIDAYPFWGHQIYNDIKKFNKANTNKRRVLFYDIRHGEADHNRWKKELGENWDNEFEYRKRPIFVHDRNEYCIIDPPLTGKGEKDAVKANELFQKLKDHDFPMPKAVHISPLYRAVQTFKKALLKDLNTFGINIDKCWVVEWLREQKTGNCADILMKEFLSGKVAPPPPGSGICEKWMEPDDEYSYSKDVKARVDRYFEELPKFDESDCIARVTHSLLNRHTLMTLEVGKGRNGIKVMNRFMLEEGGIFAYVFEMDVANKLAIENFKPLQNWIKYSEYERTIAPLRKTAFTAEIPKHVAIDSKSKEIADAIHGRNSKSKKPIGNNKNVENQTKVGHGEVITCNTNVAQDGNGDGGTRVGTNETVHSTINADSSNTVARRKKVAVREKPGVNQNDGSKRNTAAIQNVDGGRNIGSRRTTGASKNADSAGNTERNKVVGSNINRQKIDQRRARPGGSVPRLRSYEPVMHQ